jgi:hypothetical protein
MKISDEELEKIETELVKSILQLEKALYYCRIIRDVNRGKKELSEGQWKKIIRGNKNGKK